MTLESLGWTPDLDKAAEPWRKAGGDVGRVTEEQKGHYWVRNNLGEWLAEVRGKLRFEADGRESFPAVGDWVLIKTRPGEDRAVIHGLLPRRSLLVRRAAGEKVETQLLAANIDTVFIVTSANRDMNPRRLERYAALAWDSGARPVVLLNKADLAEDRAAFLNDIAAAAPAVPVHAVSALTGEGADGLAPYLGAGQTVVLVGSSGVGKSTLINRLLGQEAQSTGAARADDDRGRHTTSYRRLFVLPGGALLIDTPGLRELGLLDSGEGLSRAFEDVEEFARRCRFPDCGHESEPGCAVREAVAGGTLAAERLAGYRKLERERAYLARRLDKQAALAHKKKSKRIHKDIKRLYKDRDKS